MAKRINRHGLSRDIDRLTKRQIRQRSGFGCVICGLFLYDYHHFDPEFEHAKEHSPEGIALLCPNHHREATSLAISPDSIQRAYNQSRSRPSVTWEMPLAETPILQFGPITATRTQTFLRIDGQEFIWIEPPESPAGPPRLSATFQDRTGKPSLLIVANWWRVLGGAWDVERTGSRVVIRRGMRDIALDLSFRAPATVTVHRAKMLYGGVTFECTEREVRFGTSIGSVSTTAYRADGYETLIDVDPAGRIQIGTGGGSTRADLDVDTRS